MERKTLVRLTGAAVALGLFADSTGAAGIAQMLGATSRKLKPVPSLAGLVKTEGADGRGFRLLSFAAPEPKAPAALNASASAFLLADGSAQVACSSPLALDLDGDGIRTLPVPERFDLDADGTKDLVDRLWPRDAVLVLERDGDGVPGTDGRELLGDKTDLDGDRRPDGFADGFEALAALARQAAEEGRLRELALRTGLLGPEELASLAAAYGLRLRLGGTQGRLVRFKEAGVSAIMLASGPSRRVLNFDGRGNDLSLRKGAVFIREDGSQGPYADVWLRLRGAAAGGLAAARPAKLR